MSGRRGQIQKRVEESVSRCQHRVAKMASESGRWKRFQMAAAKRVVAGVKLIRQFVFFFVFCLAEVNNVPWKALLVCRLCFTPLAYLLLAGFFNLHLQLGSINAKYQQNLFQDYIRTGALLSSKLQSPACQRKPTNRRQQKKFSGLLSKHALGWQHVNSFSFCFSPFLLETKHVNPPPFLPHFHHVLTTGGS